MTETTLNLQSLIDERDIRSIVDEIDNAVDAKEWERCLGYFSEEIEADFTSLSGGIPGRMKAADLVSGWKKSLYRDKLSHHMRTNHRIEIDGVRAEVFSRGMH